MSTACVLIEDVLVVGRALTVERIVRRDGQRHMG
jgi:hypothetical protein